jgi:hypothetical protein
MKPKISKTLLGVLAASGMSQGFLLAQNAFFAPGDLILFFQKPGSTDSVVVGLGSAANLYRGTQAGPTGNRQATNIIKIDTQLAGLDPNWQTSTSVYAGAVATFSNNSSGVATGDQSRTLYATKSRSTVGTVGNPGAPTWDFSTSFANTTGATQVLGFANAFETNFNAAAVIAPINISKVDTDNPFTNLGLGIQGTAYKAFVGGVQQRGSASTFGAFGPVASPQFLLDLFRLAPEANGFSVGEVSGPKNIGTYEGTIVIDSEGWVSFVTGKASADPYTAWIDTFALSPADKLPEADPDGDGVDNLAEFVLNGNPTSGSDNNLPVPSVTTNDFRFTFTRRDDSEGEVAVIFEHSPDLVTWTEMAVGTNSGGGIVVAENGTNPDTVTVSLPRGTNTKLFGRLKVVK